MRHGLKEFKDLLLKYNCLIGVEVLWQIVSGDSM